MNQTKNKTRHKQLLVDEAKLRCVQKIFGVSAKDEAIERALDEALTEHESNRLAWRAHEQFLKGGGEIKDVYGLLN